MSARSAAARSPVASTVRLYSAPKCFCKRSLRDRRMPIATKRITTKAPTVAIAIHRYYGVMFMNDSSVRSEKRKGRAVWQVRYVLNGENQKPETRTGLEAAPVHPGISQPSPSQASASLSLENSPAFGRAD